MGGSAKDGVMDINDIAKEAIVAMVTELKFMGYFEFLDYATLYYIFENQKAEGKKLCYNYNNLLCEVKNENRIF